MAGLLAAMWLQSLAGIGYLFGNISPVISPLTTTRSSLLCCGAVWDIAHLGCHHQPPLTLSIAASSMAASHSPCLTHLRPQQHLGPHHLATALNQLQPAASLLRRRQEGCESAEALPVALLLLHDVLETGMRKEPSC